MDLYSFVTRQAEGEIFGQVKAANDCLLTVKQVEQQSMEDMRDLAKLYADLLKLSK